MTGRIEPTNNNVLTEDHPNTTESEKVAQHPKLGEVKSINVETRLSPLQPPEETAPKSILKRSTQSIPPKKNVSFGPLDDLPKQDIQIHETRKEARQDLIQYAVELFEQGSPEAHNELQELLAIQSINDMTTKANDEHRSVSFESLSKALRDRLGNNPTLITILDNAEAQADTQVMSSCETIGKTIDELNDNIAKLENP